MENSGVRTFFLLLGIAQGQAAVGISHQGEFPFGACGNKELVCCLAQIGRIVQGSGLGFRSQPAISHVPLGIVAGLHKHIAISGKGSGDLAVHELVIAQVLPIVVAAVVCTVNGTNQIVILGRFLLLGIAQSQAAVSIFHQGEFPFGATGDQHLFRLALDEGAGLLGAVAFSQIPVTGGFLHGNIGICSELNSQLAVHKLVVVAVIVGIVQEADQIVILDRRSGSRNLIQRIVPLVGCQVIVLTIFQSQVIRLRAAVIENDIIILGVKVDGVNIKAMDLVSGLGHSNTGPGHAFATGDPGIGSHIFPTAGVHAVSGDALGNLHTCCGDGNITGNGRCRNGHGAIGIGIAGDNGAAHLDLDGLRQIEAVGSFKGSSIILALDSLQLASGLDQVVEGDLDIILHHRGRVGICAKGIAVIPHHVIALVFGNDLISLNIGSLVPIAGTVILDAVENQAGDAHGNFGLINIISTVVFHKLHLCTGPCAPDVLIGRGIKGVCANVRPHPVVLEIDSLGLLCGRSHGRHKTDDHGKDHDQAQYPFQCLKSVLHS